jgi:hypothetical protein
MVQAHQPGEAAFRSILPEEVEWKPFPAFPPSARLAVLVGEPTQAGPYLIRVKVPSGVKLMPHRHPEDRIYTVMSGVFLHRPGRSIRRRQGQGLSARQRYRSARQYVALPLG